MASHALFGWLPSPSPTSSNANPKLFSSPSFWRNQCVYFSSFHKASPKRRRFSSSSSSSPELGPSKQRIVKPMELELADRSRSNSVPENQRAKLSFKSLFGKRSAWRKTPFASAKLRSVILLNIITLGYASSIVVLKEVEANVDPASFTVVRFALSAIPFVPFVWSSLDDVSTRNAGIELGIWAGLGYLMQALGLLTADAGRAAFLAVLTVIVVPLLDGMLGAVVPARTWFGALVSVLGVAMLESSGSPPCVGDLLNFLSAFFFGVHMLRTEHIARNTKKENFLPLIGFEVCVVALMTIGWYVVGCWSGALQDCDPSLWTWTKFWDWMVTFPWIAAVYTGVFTTGLCMWGEMAAMRDVSATETAIIYALEPVWGGGFAWFFLGERWGIAGWIGAALVLGGSLTVQILGPFPTNSCEDENGGKTNRGLVSDEQNCFSASPVVVSSKKDISDLLK